MEDITFKYQRDKQPWIKTLQGLASGIQCIGGEVPFLFFSGWIIKRLGYWYCMSLGLFSCALRFYLYSIITNPVWILPVEFLNGITFGLCHAVLVAYARIIAPPNSVTTLVGLAGALYEGVGMYRRTLVPFSIQQLNKVLNYRFQCSFDYGSFYPISIFLFI